MSRNPRNDLRKKRRRQRRNATWQCRSVDLSAYLVGGLELMAAFTEQLDVFKTKLPGMLERALQAGETYTTMERLQRRLYRNPWQWQAWWRL